MGNIFSWNTPLPLAGSQNQASVGSAYQQPYQTSLDDHYKEHYYLLPKKEFHMKIKLVESINTAQQICEYITQYLNLRINLIRMLNLQNVSDLEIISTVQSLQEELKQERRKSQTLEKENQVLQITRSLQSSGQVCNSETQAVIEKSKSLIARINNSSLDCLMKCEDLPDYYGFVLPHVVFRTLFKSGGKTESLREDAWLAFKKSTEDERMRKAIDVIEKPFGGLVELAVELYREVNGLKFPKLNFLWTGVPNGQEFSYEKFKIVERATLPASGKNRPGDKRIFTALPGLIIGTSQTPEILGQVVEITYK